ncbi:MAG: hypothetical protein KGZ97_05045 [Bacteroidetes bacterium]|nr:hypothetical protein [Bacteroidota bacterium]
MTEYNDIWNQSLLPDLYDLAAILFYLILIFLVSHYIKNRNIDKNPAYKFYSYGLFASIVGAIGLCLVYTLYYPGGDTTGYYISSEAMVNLFFTDSQAFFRLMSGDIGVDKLSYFTHQTGYPDYLHDSAAFLVVRITTIFTFLGFKNYFTTSIVFAWFFYIGFWKLYLLFYHFYKDLKNKIAFTLLFFPSVLFWGSGILKDTITLSLMSWFLYAAYFGFVHKKNVIQNILVVVITVYFMVQIKPYIIVALVPSMAIWAAWYYIKSINNRVLKYFVAPVILVFFVFLGIAGMSLFSESLGVYGSIEGIIQKAIVTYEDHLRYEQYGQHFYSLGEFDGTIGNFLSKTPMAVIAGLFRPFIWETGTVFILASAIENLLLLAFTVYVFLIRGPVKFLRTLSNEPFIVFSLLFAFIFAFAVGISSANFGALVRLKIPLIPFFATAFVVIFYRVKEGEV